jgi:hypothetical protein
LELRRLAIAPDAPRNTATRMLAIMVREIRKLRPEVVNLVSYQDTEVHTGGIYKGAGWRLDDLPKPSCREWNCHSRQRPKAQSAAVKNRWSLLLKPKRV